MKTKTTEQLLDELNEYLEYAKTWKEARVHVLQGAIEKIEELERALEAAQAKATHRKSSETNS